MRTGYAGKGPFRRLRISSSRESTITTAMSPPIIAAVRLLLGAVEEREYTPPTLLLLQALPFEIVAVTTSVAGFDDVVSQENG